MTTESSVNEQREAYFRGMVQGVGFRYTTRRIAARYEVTGYVQNLPDGRVLLVAEGSSAELDRLINAVRAEMESYIDDIEINSRPATGQYQGFDIRY
jgi:acylphosphatase